MSQGFRIDQIANLMERLRQPGLEPSQGVQNPTFGDDALQHIDHPASLNGPSHRQLVGEQRRESAYDANLKFGQLTEAAFSRRGDGHLFVVKSELQARTELPTRGLPRTDAKANQAVGKPAPQGRPDPLAQQAAREKILEAGLNYLAKARQAHEQPMTRQRADEVISSPAVAEPTPAETQPSYAVEAGVSSWQPAAARPEPTQTMVVRTRSRR